MPSALLWCRLGDPYYPQQLTQKIHQYIIGNNLEQEVISRYP